MEDQLAELTDAPGGHEGGESENPEDDMEVETTRERSQYGPSISEMYEALKQEQRLCLIDGDIGDSATIQNIDVWDSAGHPNWLDS